MTKTDRELLVAAANAAGYSWRYDGKLQIIFKTEEDWMDGEDFAAEWNPITDERDRYRLIRDLKMKIDFQNRVVSTVTQSGEYILEEWWEEPDEAHAVLRLAAKIGESKDA